MQYLQTTVLILAVGCAPSGKDTNDGAPSWACEGTEALPVPFGAAAIVDGVLGEGEWDDALTQEQPLTDAWTVDVALKHDGEALMVAWSGLLNPGGMPFGFPELLLDVGREGGDTLDGNDWWFHVSGSDCAATGAIDEYGGCAAEAEGWQANNYSNGSLLDVVEVRIALDFIGVVPGEGSLGVGLRLSDTAAFAALWPDDAVDTEPSTWAAGALCSP